MKRLTLAIDSNLSDVGLVGVAINRVCIYLGLDEDQAARMELCIVEAVTNAIRHAYRGMSGNTVEVTVTVKSDHLEFEVSDKGTPMPPAQVEQLTHGTKAEDAVAINRAALPEGGRGLQIIRDCVDHVAYASGNGRNRLQMLKLLQRL